MRNSGLILALGLILSNFSLVPVLAQNKALVSPNRNAVAVPSGRQATNAPDQAAAVPSAPTLDHALGLSSGLTMDQKCMVGDIKITVTKDAIKFVNQKDGMTLLFARPYKDVIAYNARSKRIYTCPVASFKSPYAIILLNCAEVTFCDLPLTAGENTVYRGLSARHYVFSKSFTAQQKRKFEKREVSKRAPRALDLVTASKLAIDIPVVRFADAVFSLPQSSGLPLEVRYENFTAAKFNYLISYKISRVTPGLSEFAQPTGYLKVKDISQISADENSQAGIDFMTGH